MRALWGLSVVGIDTDAGKTVVAASLLRAAHCAGIQAVALKAVQTGCAEDTKGRLCAPDVAVYRQSCPEAESRALVLLKDASSPHLAARLEGRNLSAAALAEDVRENMERVPGAFYVVEGAGGLLVPLNAEETMLDMFARLGLPALLVVPNRLGAVNHALLSVQALRARDIPIVGFVLSSPVPVDGSESAVRIRADNRAVISEMSGLACLAEFPFIADLNCSKSWERAADLAAPVLKVLAPDSVSLSLSQDPPGPLGPDALLRFDREHIWHPYTSALNPLQVREAVATQGARIALRNGVSLIDGMASWWCAIHGYNHPRLLEALHAQAKRMPHVMFGGLTHAPAVSLGQRLLHMAPSGLERVFFVDSGSVAVEVAIKMALQYQHARGKLNKSKLLTVRGGYHGDTLGAMSVCDPITGMHTLFAGVLAEQIFAPRPDCAFAAPYDPAPAEHFEVALAREAHKVAAVILEPVVQGAGGMWMYHPEYLRRVSALCREYDCLLILDEIATGFGRTGKLFACEWAGISPDIMCVGKALTGGVLTLAATLCSGEVAGGICSDGGVLMHGPTFMANPLACAVAGASLDILAEDSWRKQVKGMEAALMEGLAPCRALPGVADVRVLGAIGVLEMRRPVDVETLQDFFVRKHGVWIRPFGRNIYIMPPYVIGKEDLARLMRAMYEGAARAH